MRKIRIFDPCAGEGHALKELKDSFQCESYGIEPDTHRGKIAKQNLTRCLITDYENSRISNRAFSLLYLILVLEHMHTRSNCYKSISSKWASQLRDIVPPA